MSSGARGPVTVRMGSSTDMDAALSIYLRSNLVRRQGRAIPVERIEQVADNLRNPLTWFLIADDGRESVGPANVAVDSIRTANVPYSQPGP